MLTYPELYEQKVYEKVLKKVSAQVSEKAFQQGIEKGLESQRAQLMRLLTRRFGAVPDALAARVTGAGAEDIDRWFDRLLDAASLDELFAGT